MPCARCHDQPVTCDACGGSSSREALLSTAGCRGRYWAADVIAAVGHERPWPPFAGKARAIALRKIADLGGDDVTREARALYCWERAKDEYESS